LLSMFSCRSREVAVAPFPIADAKLQPFPAFCKCFYVVEHIILKYST